MLPFSDVTTVTTTAPTLTPQTMKRLSEIPTDSPSQAEEGTTGNQTARSTGNHTDESAPGSRNQTGQAGELVENKTQTMTVSKNGLKDEAFVKSTAFILIMVAGALFILVCAISVLIRKYCSREEEIQGNRKL